MPRTPDQVYAARKNLDKMIAEFDKALDTAPNDGHSLWVSAKAITVEDVCEADVQAAFTGWNVKFFGNPGQRGRWRFTRKGTQPKE